MKKLFTNDKFFLAMVIIAVIGRLLYCIDNLLYWPEYITSALICFLSVLCVVGLYVSYQKHAKNVMKGLAGALFMSVLTNYIVVFLPLSEEITLDDILGLICMFLAFVLFLNHFVINSDHKARPGNIKLSQWCTLLIAVLTVADTVFWLQYVSIGLDAILNIASFIGVICEFATLVCVESRLDAYRLDREKAGWTEEKGYPEGYIHESQKNK